MTFEEACEAIGKGKRVQRFINGYPYRFKLVRDQVMRAMWEAWQPHRFDLDDVRATDWMVV